MTFNELVNAKIAEYEALVETNPSQKAGLLVTLHVLYALKQFKGI